MSEKSLMFPDVLEEDRPSVKSTATGEFVGELSGLALAEKKAEGGDIKFIAPANTATEFSPPQISIGEIDHSKEDLRVDWTLIEQAREAFFKLSSAYADGSFAHASLNEVISPQQLKQIGHILEAWQLASDKYFYMESRPDMYFNSPLKQKWDDLALEQTDCLGALFDINFETFAQEYYDGSEEVLDSIGAIQSLLVAPEFEHREQLSNFVMHIGWNAKRIFFRSDPNLDLKSYSRARYNYELSKLECNKLLRNSAVVFAQEGNFEQVGLIFDHLAFSEVPLEGQFKPEDFPSAMEDARAILLNDGFAAEERRGVLREFVKVYGPIQTVDVLSAKIGELHQAGATREDIYVQGLVEMYSLIEGEEVPDPMEKLTDVYEVVDYVALERPELTAKEADKIEGIMQLSAQGAEYSTVGGRVKRLDKPRQDGKYNNRVDPQKVRVIDLGAGNARVSRCLLISLVLSLLCLVRSLIICSSVFVFIVLF